ncbi:MAG TPA: hypothetical protein VFQ40_06985, partial [Actinomycetota bacterium]|nr:hypothetical protein [Actinomycetota bacterium]
MSGSMATANTSPATRRALILLVIVAAALTAGAILQRDRALERAYQEAEDQAELYAATVLRSAVVPSDLAQPFDEARRRAVMTELQPSILSDPAVGRVRLWTPGGTLLFSSDRADDLGSRSPDPVIAAAASGLPASRLGVEPLSGATPDAEPVPTPLFQSFVPIQLRGADHVGAVAEIEHLASELEGRSDEPWWILQVGASAATVLLALLAFVSVARGARRSAPASAPGRRRGRREGSRSGDAEDLRDRLEAASTRADEAERSAAAYAAQLEQATSRIERLERRSPDEQVAELREALERSEAERALLRAG